MVIFMFIAKQEYYVGEVISCHGDNIQMMVDGNLLDVSLFNISLSDDVCPLVYQAQEVSFMVGEYGSTNNELQAYVFLDGELLQKRIVELEMGSLKIDNPLYEFYDELHAVEMAVSANSNVPNIGSEYHRTRANIMLGSLTTIYVILLTIILRKKVRKKRKF